MACPQDHSPLRVDVERSELVCTGPACGLAFPVREGIPVLLLDEARTPGGGAAATDGSED
nr:Trm112 family protein [Motilibacter aurantiacus]